MQPVTNKLTIGVLLLIMIKNRSCICKDGKAIAGATDVFVETSEEFKGV